MESRQRALHIGGAAKFCQSTRARAVSIVRKTKRPRHSRRRLDLTAMREALADGRVHTCLGLVVARDGAHFSIEEDDILVELDLIPNEEPVTARMGAVGGGQGLGIWFVPPVRSEVAVLVPDGELACGPVIVGVLSSGGLPSGVAEGVTVIANSSKVLIHDGSGGAEPLITKSQYDLHTHPTGTGPSGMPDNAASSGTTVLEAK